MARRRQATSIDKLVKQLNELDAQRKALAARIRQAIDSTLTYVGASIQLAGEGTGFVAGVRGPGTPGRPARKKRKMSAAARKAISAAQKKRWAKQKAAAK